MTGCNQAIGKQLYSLQALPWGDVSQEGPVHAVIGCKAAEHDVRTLPVIALGAQQCAQCVLLTVMGSQDPGTAAQQSRG